MNRYLLIAFLFMFSSALLAQHRSLQAVKINQPIKIDGNLDDAAWQNIEPAGDFTTSFPTFGQPASEKTIVKIAYDNIAVYVGAYMYANPFRNKKRLNST